MNDPMIRIESLKKRFETVTLRSVLRRRKPEAHQVLNGIDLAIGEGEFVGLLGANGAGKTTLLKTIATLLEPDAGVVQVGGFDVVHESQEVRNLLGYALADDRSFHWRLSAIENLQFFASLEGIGGRSRDSRIEYLLRRLDLSSFPNRPVGQYSSGMKQRLAIARGLLKQPRVLLMDEPTRSIDRSHAADVWRLVQDELDASGGSLVLVTHQLEEARALCGRIAVLSEGRIVLDTDTSGLDRYTSGIDGYAITLRNFSASALPALRAVPGVRDVQVASRIGEECQLDLSTWNGDQALAGFFSAITDSGAAISSFNRATPVQAMLDQVLATRSEAVA